MEKKVTHALDPLEKLLWLVKQACAEERGRRQELAEACGVRISQVGEWLRGDGRKPNGLAALRMLRWLEDTDRAAWRLYRMRPKPADAAKA